MYSLMLIAVGFCLPFLLSFIASFFLKKKSIATTKDVNFSVWNEASNYNWLREEEIILQRLRKLKANGATNREEV